jgi:hypothetical protein
MPKTPGKFILLFLLVISIFSRAQTIWTVGPMLHVNFGAKKIRVSYALEFAYWNFSHFPYSIDFAAEYEKKRIRFYSELQTGIGVTGVAAGPVLEFQTDSSKVKLGFQYSFWANYYWGFDFRMRFIDNHTFLAPGTYLKVGFNGRDENGERIEHHSDDWDFDD